MRRVGGLRKSSRKNKNRAINRAAMPALPVSAKISIAQLWGWAGIYCWLKLGIFILAPGSRFIRSGPWPNQGAAFAFSRVKPQMICRCWSIREKGISKLVSLVMGGDGSRLMIDHEDNAMIRMTAPQASRWGRLRTIHQTKRIKAPPPRPRNPARLSTM